MSVKCNFGKTSLQLLQKHHMQYPALISLSSQIDITRHYHWKLDTQDFISTIKTRKAKILVGEGEIGRMVSY